MSLSWIYEIIRYRYHYVGIAVETMKDLYLNLAFCYAITFAYIVTDSSLSGIWIVVLLIVSTLTAVLFCFSFRMNTEIYNELYRIAKNDDTIFNRLQEVEGIDKEDYYRWVTMEAFDRLTKKLDDEFIKRHPGMDQFRKFIIIWYTVVTVFMIIRVISHMIGQ